MKAAVIIPALNEEESIGLVLQEVPKDLVGDIIVVDNGSTDNTAESAARWGARVVKEDRRGYGAACLRGIAALPADADVVVILDADHSDFPEDLVIILGPLVRGEADMVIGSRVLGESEKGALPWNQRFGNRLACSLMRILYGARFTDMGPFRAIRRNSLAELNMTDRSFGWNVEMQVKAVMNGMSIMEVPVRYRKRIGRSKISGTVKGTVLAGVKIIGTIFRHYPRHVVRKENKQ